MHQLKSLLNKKKVFSAPQSELGHQSWSRYTIITCEYKAKLRKSKKVFNQIMLLSLLLSNPRCFLSTINPNRHPRLKLVLYHYFENTPLKPARFIVDSSRIDNSCKIARPQSPSEAYQRSFLADANVDWNALPD